MRRDGVPAAALRRAVTQDRIAISAPLIEELVAVLHRPRLARFIDPLLRADLIFRILTHGVMFAPTLRVTDCRDAKDNLYLELAQESAAGCIVSSDEDLLCLSPWRGIPVLRPAAYMAS